MASFILPPSQYLTLHIPLNSHLIDHELVKLVQVRIFIYL